jgi:VWFA-related protein
VSATIAPAMRCLLTILLLCSVSPLPGQQNSAQPLPAQDSERLGTIFHGDIFHSNVRRVILDVVVTDSNDQPIRGLSRDDFLIKEDGKPQRVLSFDAHDFSEVPKPLPALPSLPSNTWVNVPAVPEKGPLYVLLYDMVNMDVDDQATARKQLLKFISDKPPGARFAIYVLSDGLRLVQGFTADQNQLFAAMDPSSPRPHVPKIFLYGDNYGRGQVGPIVSVFTRIAHFLEGLPERKNVIWITGSVPTTILSADANSSVEAVSYNDEIKEAINAMAHSHVAVYPVDVRGVALTHIQARPQGGAGGSAMTTANDSAALNASYATEGDIAIATGGRAFFSTNDLTHALAQATEAGANYYTLSYSPSNENYDGRPRSIHVELAKRDSSKHDLLHSGSSLAYRRSYYADEAGSRSQSDKGQPTDLLSDDPAARRSPIDEPASSLMANLRHGAPVSHQLFFGAHVHLVGSPNPATTEQMSALAKQESFSNGKKRSAKSSPVSLQTYAIDYTVSAQQLNSGSNPHANEPFLLQVAVAVFDADGQTLTTKLQHTHEVVVPASANSTETIPSTEAPVQPNFLRFQQRIDVPANAASLRLAVRDVATDRVGALEVALPLAPEPETQAKIGVHSPDSDSEMPDVSK